MERAGPSGLPDTAWASLLVTVGLSLWGAATVIVALSAERLYSLPMVAATLLPFVLYGSRNPRLLFFVGAIFSAMLGLSINFARRIHMGGAASYSIDAVDLFLLPLVVFLLRDLAVGYRRELRLTWVSAWWVGAMVLGLWSVAIGPYRELAALELVRMLKCWLLFLVVINECVRVRHFGWAVAALALGVLVNVVVALLQFWLKHTLGLEALGEPSAESVLGANFGVYLSAGSVYRVSGLVGHPNLMGAYLALLLPMFIGLLLVMRPLTRLAMACLIIASLGALVLTLSRAAWVDFAAAILLLIAALFTLSGLRGRHMAIKAGMLTMLVLVAVAASGPVIQRITTSDAGATDFRWQWVGVAWRMVQDRPVLGFGLNMFSHQLTDYSPYSVERMVELFGELWPVVHNVYFLVWAEQGTIGLLLFLGLQVHVFWLAVRNARTWRHDLVGLVSLGGACGMLAIAIDGMASFFQRVPAPARVWWIVMGLVVAAHLWNEANAARRPALQASPGKPR